MISVIITAYKEERTVGKAIEAFLNQDYPEEKEVLVACPDKETKVVIDKYTKAHKNVKYVKDPGKGKPIALNICFKKAKGDKLILTDGDVYVSNNSIKELMKQLNKENIGAVTSRPRSVNPKTTMLGYFSHLLTDIGAHHTRLKYVKRNQFIVCSGYLFAMKKLFTEIPEDALSDDAVMSYMVAEKGYKIGYAPKAQVYVKFPTHLKDWIKQKRRSAGGYNQIESYFPKHKRMRSFWEEIKEGWYKPFTYPENFQEYIWTVYLYFIRLYLWFLIYKDINIKKKNFNEIWVRIESTK